MPYGVDKTIIEDRTDNTAVFKDLSEIVCRLEGVDTNRTDLKKGVCLKNGVVI